jgi:hypothetical protein
MPLIMEYELSYSLPKLKLVFNLKNSEWTTNFSYS